MTKLPVELKERIVDFTADDPATLKKCALAHSDFLPRCRVHLFQTVFLRQNAHYFRFRKLIKRSPHIAQLPTSLILGIVENPGKGGYAKPKDPLLPIPQILDQLPNVRELSIGNTNGARISAWHVPSFVKEPLLLAVPRSNITSISFPGWLSTCVQYDHDYIQAFLRRCTSAKVPHLRLWFSSDRDLTRASASDGLVVVEALYIRWPNNEPSNLVPENLPLLDLRGLKSFALERSEGGKSINWIRGIAKHCFETLENLDWKPNSADLRMSGDDNDYYPLSQLPVLKHLCIDTRKRGDRPAVTALFLRRFLNTLSSTQVLKTLKIQCYRQDWHSTADEVFAESMTDFLNGVTNVERTVISISGVADKDGNPWPTLKKLRKLGLEGEYPGTSCILEYDRRYEEWTKNSMKGVTIIRPRRWR